MGPLQDLVHIRGGPPGRLVIVCPIRNQSPRVDKISHPVYRRKTALGGQFHDSGAVHNGKRVCHYDESVGMLLACRCEPALEIFRSPHLEGLQLDTPCCRDSLRLPQCLRRGGRSWIQQYGDTRQLWKEFFQEFKSLARKTSGKGTEARDIASGVG